MIRSVKSIVFILAIFPAFKSCFGQDEKVASRHSEDLKSDCLSPKVRGPCRFPFPRYYYDATADQCIRFIYGGCQGNGNNYRTKKQCEFRCINRTSIEEESNNAESPEERSSNCSLLPETGPCRARFTRYYYSSKLKQCIEFVYGGCRGNANNYMTKQQCEMECKGMQSDEESFEEIIPDCSSPKDSGLCYGYMRRFYFDESTGSCKTFVYGGCKGNGNNYRYLQECLRACRDRDVVCLLPAETGPCRARMPRYYFDIEFGICKEFVYGGCSGNGNNFETIEECSNFCQI